MLRMREIFCEVKILGEYTTIAAMKEYIQRDVDHDLLIGYFELSCGANALLVGCTTIVIILCVIVFLVIWF